MILHRCARQPLATGADNEFPSTWKAPGAEQIDFTGRKVAAVLIADDRRAGGGRGGAGARDEGARRNRRAAYRVIPKELLTDKDAAKAWFEKSASKAS